MNKPYDVLIVGGGVVGLTAALAMAQCKLTVAVLDAGSLTKEHSTQPDSRVYAINHTSRALLNELGAWSHLDKKRVSPYHHMHVWDALNGAAIDFDSRSIAAADLGDIIDESALKEALLEQMTHCKTIHLFADTVIKEVRHLDKTIAVLSEDQTWQGQLLMIADGARSPTREHLGVQLTQWAYQQQAIVATVHTEKPHQQTAWQVFNPDGPLAFLPLSDPHQCSIVWSADTQRSDYLSQLSDEAFNQELTLAFAHKLGAVNLLSPRHQYPLCMRHAQQYVGTQWILLGDSAHTIHPLAGLGLNVGLADVALWYQKVKEDKNALSSKKALGAYQRERKSAVWQTILLMEGFKRLFSFSATPISTLRGLGIRACNQLTPLKRLFIEHAAGE